MNLLLGELQKSLTELDLGLSGALAMTSQMTRVAGDLLLDKVPETWAVVAFASLRPLGSWFKNLLERAMQLSDWALELQVPKSVWLAGLFNPTAFLTAVMQAVALAWSYDLDAMFLTTEVLRKGPHQVYCAAPEEVMGLEEDQILQHEETTQAVRPANVSAVPRMNIRF